jgi:hypothetical protein
MSERRRNLVFAAVAGAIGFAFAWALTSPSLLVRINWDAGSLIAKLASGLVDKPWNAHFAELDLYVAAHALVRPFGGTWIDGVRFATAIFFAAGAAMIADLVRRLAGSRAVAAALTAVWMTAWVNVFLLLSLEDNILFLAPAAGVIAWCVRRADEWSLADSAGAALLAAAAALLSWQALVYLGPAFYCAAFAGPRARPLRARLRDAGALIAFFFAALVAYVLASALFSRYGARALLAELFSAPKGNFSMRPLGDVRGQLRAIGTAMKYFASHSAYSLPPSSLRLEVVGALTVAAEVALFAAATVWSWRARRWAMHVLAATLLLFTVVAPLYLDADYRYLVRYDFVPLCLVPLAALAVGAVRARRRFIAPAAAAALLALALAQAALGWRWQRAQLAGYPLEPKFARPHTEPYWYGREGRSWYAYFRALKRAHPRACRFLFALDEVSDGRWNLDIMGALYSELPRHEVIAPAAALRDWRFPPHALTRDAAELFVDDGCSYFSEDARRALTAPAPGG